MNITAMTYNIGHYNMGLSKHGYPPELMDSKVAGYKELIMQFAPEIIGVQEDNTYCDQAQTIKAQNYLYKPVYRYRVGGAGSTIKTMFPVISGTAESGKLATGASYKRGVWRVEDRRVMVISVHATAHAGNSQKRKQDYQDTFAMAAIEDWDTCVICGDFNTLEDADKDNLTELCDAHGFQMAIGTYLPWVDTFIGRQAGQLRHSFDNVLVSGGSIKRVQVLRDWWERLYSDHVPVICEIDLG